MCIGNASTPECSDIIPQMMQLTVDTNLNSNNLNRCKKFPQAKQSKAKHISDWSKLAGMVTPKIPLLLLLLLPPLHQVAGLWNVKSLC